MSSATYYDQPNSQPGNAHVSVPSAGPLGGPHGAGIGGVEQQHAYQQSGGYQGQEQGYGYQQQQHPGYNGGEGAGYNAQQQQMGSSNNAPGAIQPPTSTGGGQAAVPDNRDGITKWLDKIEKKFGGERFNNPENAEKNRKLNASIVKRLTQIGKLAMKKGPGMLMKMAR